MGGLFFGMWVRQPGPFTLESLPGLT